ncbi:MAG: hypothetical protein ABFR75_08570 [Acidobacteriota bacterium]
MLFVTFFRLFPGFNVLETKNLKLIYFGEANSYLVSHAARCFENSLKYHMNKFNYIPSEKITVILHDFSDFGNAGASSIPNNRIFFSIAPFNYIFEIILGNERLNWTMNHELVHIQATDQATAGDKFFRSVFFGKVAPTSDNPITLLYGYLTSPRDYAPRWYHEGLAVFMETWMSGGFGRTQGGYDEMAFRSKIKEESPLYRLVGLESAATKKNFQVGVNAYLYGTRFFGYLAYNYGPEKIIQWSLRLKKSKAYFARQFKHIFGRSLDKEWGEWIEWEKNFQTKNLERLSQFPITFEKRITNKRLGYISRPYFDKKNGKVYMGVNYPGQIAHLASMDLKNGKLKKICNIKGPDLFSVTSLAYDPLSDSLFYTTDNTQWRDLKKVDLRTGKISMLIKDGRIGDLAFNHADKSIWGVRHSIGISTLVRIPPPYKKWKQILSWPYGKDIYDIDISNDGKMLVGALTNINGKQLLIKMDTEKLINGDYSYETLYDFGKFSPANFVFSSDGKFLFGSSYYSGVSNIYSYDLAKKDINIVSNCETGYFRPVPVSKDSILVFRYTSEGFLPCIIQNRIIDNVKAVKFLGKQMLEKYPQLKEWKNAAPSSIDIDSLTVYKGKYNILRDIKFRSVYPVIEGYKNYTAYGFSFNIADSIPLNKLNFSISYSPDADLPSDEKLHYNINLTLSNWNFAFSHNKADFYDLFGPTKTSRKGDSAELQFQKTLILDEPRSLDLGINIAAYFGLERMPEFQNVETTFDKFYNFNISLKYKDLRASLGAVDYEKGYKWETFLSGYYVNKKLFPRINTNLDLGLALPIHHSALWLRSSAGYAGGDRDEPFANFYFGGFGNNWIDHQDFSRYRKFYSFPGIDINEAGGNNYAKLMLEWTLPPILFKQLGIPSFYANWAGFSLFSSALVTNFDRKEHKRFLTNIGIQLDIRFMILSNHQMTLSLGYARAFEKDIETSEGWMISLKLL